MVLSATLRSLAYAALASGPLLTASCHRADIVADDVTSAEDMGQGNEENATTADLVAAAAASPTKPLSSSPLSRNLPSAAPGTSWPAR